MRFLVFIPALVLFLSHIPFIHEIPMEVKMAMTEEEAICMMEMGGNVEKSCIPGKDTGASGENEGCCNRSETTTTCICVFTFAAPVQDIKTFQLGTLLNNSTHTGFLQLKWKDPHIASPGQPPDFA